MSNFCANSSWLILPPIEQSIKDKIECTGTPLSEWNVKIYRGVLTGYNDAFIISKSIRNELIAADPKSAEIIRPILRGRDIKRYSYEFANLWIIATHNGLPTCNVPPIDISKYPAVKAYLDQYLPQLEKRQDKGISPYNLRSCAYMDDFSKQKIVWGNLCLSAQYSYVAEEYFVSAPATMIVPGNKFLLAVLNSKVADFYIRNLGVTRSGGYFEYKPMFVEKLPVPNIGIDAQQCYADVVDSILAEKLLGHDVTLLENHLNNMIFDLYGLTQEERMLLAGVPTNCGNVAE